MSAAEPIRIGTRGSELALTQARAVAASIPGDCEIVTIKTRDSAPATDKSRFVGEIERALRDERVDVAVHSAKDVPAELMEGTAIAAVPARERAADVWVGAASSLEEAPDGARVGTSSLRRRAQLLAARPDLQVTELRGNVDTRLARVAEEGLDGAVLALAGLVRLGREREAAFELAGEVMVPAPGQGALALQIRDGDERAAAAVAPLDDPASHRELTCERAAVAELRASCNTPVGIRAVAGGELVVRGWCGLPDGSQWILDEVRAAGDPAETGRMLARRMISAGADELLERAEQAVRGAAG